MTIDAAAKELIMFWNQKERFVLVEIDDEHILVKSDAVEVIRQRLKDMNDELNYDAPLEVASAHE